MLKSLVLLPAIFTSFQAFALSPILEEEVSIGNLSYFGATTIEMVVNDVRKLNLSSKKAFILEVERRVNVESQKADLQIEGNNKLTGLAVRNIIRVVVSTLKPSTAEAPTHTRGVRNYR